MCMVLLVQCRDRPLIPSHHHNGTKIDCIDSLQTTDVKCIYLLILFSFGSCLLIQSAIIKMQLVYILNKIAQYLFTCSLTEVRRLRGANFSALLMSCIDKQNELCKVKCLSHHNLFGPSVECKGSHRSQKMYVAYCMFISYTVSIGCNKE